jgi:hypothetical protein
MHFILALDRIALHFAQNAHAFEYVLLVELYFLLGRAHQSGMHVFWANDNVEAIYSDTVTGYSLRSKL